MRHAIAILKREREREHMFMAQDAEAAAYSASTTWRTLAKERIPVREQIIDELDDAIETLEEAK